MGKTGSGSGMVESVEVVEWLETVSAWESLSSSWLPTPSPSSLLAVAVGSIGVVDIARLGLMPVSCHVSQSVFHDSTPAGWRKGGGEHTVHSSASTWARLISTHHRIRRNVADRGLAKIADIEFSLNILERCERVDDRA